MLVFDMHLKHGQLLFLNNLTYVSFFVFARILLLFSFSLIINIFINSSVWV